MKLIEYEIIVIELDVYKLLLIVVLAQAASINRLLLY